MNTVTTSEQSGPTKYSEVYTDFLKSAHPVYSQEPTFAGYDFSCGNDERIALNVPSGPFEIKINQLKQKSRKRKSSGGFASSALPRRQNLLKTAAGGMFDPDKENIILTDETCFEKKQSHENWSQAGLPDEEFEAAYARLGMPNLKQIAIDQARTSMESESEE